MVATSRGYRRRLKEPDPIIRVDMGLSLDRTRDAGFRRVVAGLAVVASTVSADTAAFVGRLGLFRIMEFSVAGLCAAAVTFLASADFKKKPFPCERYSQQATKMWTLFTAG